MEWKLFATEDAVSLSADKESLIIDDPDRPGSMYKARNSEARGTMPTGILFIARYVKQKPRNPGLQ